MPIFTNMSPPSTGRVQYIEATFNAATIAAAGAVSSATYNWVSAGGGNLLPANAKVLGCDVEHTSTLDFTPPLNGGLTLNVGLENAGGSNLIEALEMHIGVSSPNTYTSQPSNSGASPIAFAQTHNRGALQPDVTLDAGGDTLDQCTSGSFTVRIYFAVVSAAS